jgi:hypothetical protein
MLELLLAGGMKPLGHGRRPFYASFPPVRRRRSNVSIGRNAAAVDRPQTVEVRVRRS